MRKTPLYSNPFKIWYFVIFLTLVISLLFAAPALGSSNAGNGNDLCASQGEGSAVGQPSSENCDPQVLPTDLERPDDDQPPPTDPPEVRPESLTATGFDSSALAIILSLLIFSGATLLIASKRRK